MGLDQNFFVTKDDISFYNKPSNSKSIQYYRGHWQLQLYLDKLYKERGGEKDFSCANLELSKEDLLQLKETIQTFSLPRYNKYYDVYFTEEEYSKMEGDQLMYARKREQESYKEDMQTIQKCLHEIEHGNKIFYRSWW